MKSNIICNDCAEFLESLLVGHRSVTLTRLGEKKIIVKIVPDQDPNAVQFIEDRDVASCLCRILK